MNIEQFFIMRHELVLTLAIIILIIGEIATSDESKKKMIPFSIWIFGLVTLIGAPSYTSAVQKWNGTSEILNPIPLTKKMKPSATIAFTGIEAATSVK